jgi:XisH protein
VSAKDVFHDAVRRALEKEQWIITNDPLLLRFGGVEMYIDLAAEQLMSAEKDGEKIAVEIKSFIGVSATTEFSTALGQFLKYQLALEEEQPDRILYLAIPFDAYRSFFTLELPRRLVERYRVNLIVYEPEAEAICRWQKQTNTDK